MFNKSVGDTVYYPVMGPEYVVRKSKVVKVEESRRNHLLSISYVLENGARARHWEAFGTKEEALKALADHLKERLAWHQVEMENLHHKMAYEESALQRIKQLLKQK